MTVCNMTIEGGGRAGMIAPDDTTFEWVEGREAAPEDFAAAVAGWRELYSEDGASFDAEHVIDASALSPQVTWGTNPAMVTQVTDAVPEPSSDGDQRALEYMALEAGTPIQEIALDRVFIGSCTNSRIGDLREAAEVVRGRKVAASVDAMVVPGSQQVAAQAEAEGLDDVFKAAGFDWRSAGCSMCLGHEPRHALARRALRIDLEPQLRGAPGPRRPHAPRQPPDGRRRRHRGPFRRHQGVELSMDAVRSSKARSRSSTAPTSTPTRSSPSSSSSGSSGPDSASSCSTTGRRRTAGTCRPTRSSPRGATSAADRRASTPRGRSRTTGSARSWRPSFADIFYSNCTKIGLLPVVLGADDVAALMQAGEAKVDLEAQKVAFDGRSVGFDIDQEIKRRLLNGLDDIGVTLQSVETIDAYEQERERQGPVTLLGGAEGRHPAKGSL